VPTQFERYRFRDGVTPLSEATFNQVFADLDLRLAALESERADWLAALQAITDQGLARINVQLSQALADVSVSLHEVIDLHPAALAHLTDQANPHAVTAAQAGAVPLASDIDVAEHALLGVRMLGYGAEVNLGLSGSARTIKLSDGARQRLTVNTSVTLAIDTAGAAPGDYRLVIVNQGYWTVSWPTGLGEGRWRGTAGVPAAAGLGAVETWVTITWTGTALVGLMERVGSS